MCAGKRVPKTAAVILAAGGSTRMTLGHKLLLPIQGKPMIAFVVDQVLAAEFDPVVMVTGHNGPALQAAIQARPLEVAANHRWRDGLASSLICGLKALPPDAAGALFFLADMPQVDSGLLTALKELFIRKGGRSIVYPTYQGQQGNPVIFPSRFFNEIMELKGDRGAQSVLHSHVSDAVALPVDSPAVLADCDTDDDYSNLQTSMED